MLRPDPAQTDFWHRLGVATGIWASVATLGILLVVAVARNLDRANPPPLDPVSGYSVEVLDRNNAPLRIFANQDGRWRLPVTLDTVDPDFLKILIAYEDKRFYRHLGVDPLAMARAAWQWLMHGRIVSGGSTITMQLARLLEPRTERTIAAKLYQMVRALQIERRLGKREILERYLTLTPYGGNIEGIRAASLSWFNKEPGSLELREIALLVALPQSPETRRPDRFPDNARSARDRVVERMAAADLVPALEPARIRKLDAPTRRHPMPMLAAHLAQKAIDQDPRANVHKTTIDRTIQARLETLARDRARKLGKRISVAILLADSKTGEILASVGSAGLTERGRHGWIDMTRAYRSPGSTLKPFVYGLAIDDGHVLPETLISDRPADFGGYRPTNFDTTYRGDVTVREALQASLNVPAVHLLDAVSPVRLNGRLRRAHVSLKTPDHARPGLSLALGGASLSLTELVQLFANLASSENRVILLGDGVHSMPIKAGGRPVLSRTATWHVTDMLKGIPEPAGSKPAPIAYKTGTSYGYRDAWSVGYDGRYVIGVWVGRADNGPVPGSTGITTAAPILFEAYAETGLEPVPFSPAPAGAVRTERANLPPALRQFENVTGTQRFSNIAAPDRLRIEFPADRSTLEIGRAANGRQLPVVIKLQGGKPPYRLIGRDGPIAASRRQHLYWSPRGKGFFEIGVADAMGQVQSLRVRIE